MCRYTTTDATRILLNGSTDVDEVLDMKQALSRVPPNERAFWGMYMQHGDVSIALREVGITGNPQRFFDAAIRGLVREMNGDEENSLVLRGAVHGKDNPRP